MVGFTCCEVSGLADIAFGVGGIEDAVDTDHGLGVLSNLKRIYSC